MDIKHNNGYSKLAWPIKIAYDILNRDRKKCLEHGAEMDIPIEDRFKDIFNEYIEYIKKLKEKILLSPETIREIKCNLKLITKACKSYLSGDIKTSLNCAVKILDRLKERIVEMPVDMDLFRARETSLYHSLNRKEMFHIPYNKRFLVGNQRYSISGIPCLYLGQSTYICWEELGRPNPYTCNFVGVRNQRALRLLDMTIPQSSSDSKMISIIPIILSCCLYSRKNRVFKQEYILPQLIMQAIITRKERVWGIKYQSTSFFYSDFPFVSDSNTLESDIQKHNNYVFPAIGTENNDSLSEELVAIFHMTNTFSIWQQQLVESKEYTPVASKQELDGTINYLDNSTFGQLDRIFNKNKPASLEQEITTPLNTILSEITMCFDKDSAVSGEEPET
ncbi:putative uncharacterized protein [Alistipes sp. CAG:831]|nr:putative uncharacterized protein [Alistipes sp. CAG:831]